MLKKLKYIFSNDLHPLNKELISVIKDESKYEKSIDVIFSAFLSYAESKKWDKLSTGEENFIIIQLEFISKGFLDNDSDRFRTVGKYLDEMIGRDSAEEYLLALKMRDELLKNYNYDMHKMQKLSKKLVKKYR